MRGIIIMDHKCASCGHKGAKLVRIIGGKRKYFKSLKCVREYLKKKNLKKKSFNK